MLKKVLFVSHTGALSSGGEISNFYLIKYLKKKNYNVRVVSPDWDNNQYKSALKKEGIHVYSYPYTWWDNKDAAKISPENIKSLRKICEVIDDFSPSIVITNTTVVPWGAFASALKAVPHIWITREFATGEFKYIDEKMDFIKKFSNLVIANSKELALYTSEKYDISVKSFYSYVDTGDIKINKNITKTRLVFPSFINERKNQIVLIKALAVLKAKNPSFDTKVVLIGNKDKNYWEKINRIISKKSLKGLVEYHNFRPDPWLLIGPNDILIQTSVSESIGRTIVEAMKLGIPVIGSDIPGHKEAFTLGGGILFESQNHKDLADKIEHALINRKEIQEKTKKIKNKIKKNMSEEACNEPFIDAMNLVYSQQNPQKDLRHIEPYLNIYIKDREKTILHNDAYILSLNQQIQTQKKIMDERMDIINRIQESKSYKIANLQTKIISKILLPARFIRRKK